MLYIIALILIVGWLLGFFAFAASGFIHALLVIGLIILIVKIVGNRGRW